MSFDFLFQTNRILKQYGSLSGGFQQWITDSIVKAAETYVKIRFIITVFTYFCQKTVEFYNIHILILHIFVIMWVAIMQHCIQMSSF